MVNNRRANGQVSAAHWLAVSLVMALLWGTTGAWAVSAQPDYWGIRTVESPKFFTNLTDRSLRLDGAGYPHIAYGGDHLYYAWKNTAGWHYETVDTARSVGAFASLALDAAGYPHIAYQDLANEHLKYAYKDASQVWHVETVVSSGQVGYYTSLALDQNGYPHISHAYFMGSLYCAYQDASGWHFDNPDSGMEVHDSSIAIDSNGYPHIAYATSEPDELRHAYLTASGWQVETVRAVELTDDSVSLALNSTGQECISYYDESSYPTGKLNYYDGAVSTIDSGSGAWWQYSSLALDSKNRPRVSYRDGLNRDLKYAYRDATGWHTMVIDAGDDAGLFTSLAIDSVDQPHISYMDTMTLKYAYRIGSGWHVETVDVGGNTGSAASLALDGAGSPHIAYHDGFANYDLKYARWDAGLQAWQIETVEAAGNVGWSPSLALDGTSSPHIAYGDSSGDVVKYAYHDAGGWHVETVGSSPNGEGSLALDAAGHPHVAYSAPAGLTYAFRDAAGWHGELVAAAETCRFHPRLALDQAGNPHILCIQYGDPESLVKYAYRDGSGWHAEVVDTLGGIGGAPALDLDASGAPHAAYYDTGPHGAGPAELRYASRGTSTWQIEVVDDEGGDVSLDLDVDGYPHLVYGDKYAYQDAALIWHVEVVPGNPGYARSLALTATGRPRVVYGDSPALKYAMCITVGEPRVYLPTVGKR